MIPENWFLVWNILPNGNVIGQRDHRQQGERASRWLLASPRANPSSQPGLGAARQPPVTAVETAMQRQHPYGAFYFSLACILPQQVNFFSLAFIGVSSL